MNRSAPLLVIAALAWMGVSGCGDPGEGDPASASSAAAPASVAADPPEASTDPAASADPGAAANVAAEGFPQGQTTPEGVACDMARAFINRDAALWRQSCYPASASKAEYAAFLDEMASQMEKVSAMSPEQAKQAGGPKQIGTVYAARNLSRNGPASYGYAAMQLTEVKFVDVVAPTWEGTDFLARTLVVQRERDGKWYAIPRPDLFPLLSEGLNEEQDSQEVWAPPQSPPSSSEAAGQGEETGG